MTITNRHPSSKARLVATTGAVIIHTADKVTTPEGERLMSSTVVMTPTLTRQIASQLISLADLAEGKGPPDFISVAQSWKGRYIQ